MYDTVLVTGFGLFRNYKVNASWEIAKVLQEMNLEELGIRLVTEQISVAYATVDTVVPELWKRHNPQLVVHLGVSSLATQITLETLAYKSGYRSEDVKGDTPKEGYCAVGNKDCLSPTFDVNEICKEMNESSTDVKYCVSSNAGRYLCEYIYYTSLNIDDSRVLFIHVPELNKPYTAEQMALCIKNIILVLLKKIRSFDNRDDNLLQQIEQ